MCLDISCELNSHGFHAYHMRSPTVPVGSERIRIVLNSINSVDQVKSFVDLLEHVAKDVVVDVNNRSTCCTVSTTLPTSQSFLPSKS